MLLSDYRKQTAQHRICFPAISRVTSKGKSSPTINKAKQRNGSRPYMRVSFRYGKSMS